MQITFEQAEYTALARLAVGDLRAIPDQARFIIREELTRRGLLTQEAPAIQPQEHPQAVTA
ncbi:MAG TPA: hypothetical protein PKM21_02985 [Anaerolineales bacterium]|nr:hypothetical protein [Anaerolineales bacterium]